VLIGGLSLYIAGSLLCAGAASITILVLARIIQACGAAAGSAMALALTKDLCFIKYFMERQEILYISYRKYEV
jgi:MFS family permease